MLLVLTDRCVTVVWAGDRNREMGAVADECGLRSRPCSFSTLVIGFRMVVAKSAYAADFDVQIGQMEEATSFDYAGPTGTCGRVPIRHRLEGF